jgi:hypothetical protein
MRNEAMINEVVINEVSLPIKELDGKRVVSFKDIDLVHGRPDGTARRNFNSNQKHFIQNEDYYVVNQGNSSMYEFRTIEKIPPKGITLLTESGYLMIVKSFTDDKAWEVQRKLVNSYFKLKEVQHDLSEELSVDMLSLYQTVLDLSNNFKVMCNQVNSMGNAFNDQFEEFKRVIQQLGSLSLPVKRDPLKIEEITAINVSDPIRDTIKPLAELYHDKSVGYNNTYRKVYAAMEVDWKRRQSRYRNVNGNKNRPSKMHLLEEDTKLLIMFNTTVNKLIEAFTEVSYND